MTELIHARSRDPGARYQHSITKSIFQLQVDPIRVSVEELLATSLCHLEKNLDLPVLRFKKQRAETVKKNVSACAVGADLC